MPKLWSGTIESHRQQVQSAVVAATAKLVAEHGLRGVTMSRIAQDAGIGRATLYKYFPDVESILAVWHDEQVTEHLNQLTELRLSAANPEERLISALEFLTHISHQASKHGAGSDFAASLHAGEHVTKAERDLRRLLRGLIDDAVEAGFVRADMPADELVSYCLNAAAGARQLGSQAAVQRLTELTMTSLRP